MKMEDKLSKAFERREELFDDEGTNCFRLFNSSGDGIRGLSIDLYGEYLLIQFFEPQLFYEEKKILRIISNSLRELPFGINGILLKNRVKTGGRGNISAVRRSRLIEGGFPPADYSVRQNGVNAIVDLIGGQNTGIFLDMRVVRKKLLSFYGEFENMLNLFSYTSIFSVHAIKHGVKHAINVDLSKSNLRKAMMNYYINDLDCDNRDFISGDTLQWIRKFKKAGKDFSFIVFDPPTFSRNKKRFFSVERDFREYLNLLSNISSCGYVLTSINSQTVSESEYMACHPSGWSIIFYDNESEDFRYSEIPYLKVGLWVLK